MITFIYSVLVFLVLRFSVTLFNFLSNPKLGFYGKRFTDKVSVIIDGERADAVKLLATIEAQDYKNLEVIFQAEIGDPVIEKTSGKYLLFLDSHTTISKGLINNLIYRVKVFDLDLLSLIPTRKISGLGGWLTQPLNDGIQLSLFPLRFVNVSNHLAFSVVNDACVFYSTEGYRKVHNRATKSDERDERLKIEVLLGNRFVYINETLQAGSLLETLGRSVPVVLLYLALVIVGPVVMFLMYEPAFLFLPLGLIFLTKVMISFLTVQNPFINVFMHPFQMLVMTALLLKGMWMKLFTPGKH